MTTAHSTLTGANLHEPKGIAAAAAGTVYQATGAGSGTFVARLPSQTGNSGKFLTTNGTAESWAAATNPVFARGTVTISGGTPTIASGSANAASVSKLGTGQFRVTMTSAASSASYQAFVSAHNAAYNQTNIDIQNKTTTTFDVYFWVGGVGFTDPVAFDFMVLGG